MLADSELFSEIRSISSDGQRFAVDAAADLWARRRAMVLLGQELPWVVLADPAEWLFTSETAGMGEGIDVFIVENSRAATPKWHAAVISWIEMIKARLDNGGGPPPLARSSADATAEENRFRESIEGAIRQRNLIYERTIQLAPQSLLGVLARAAIQQYIDGAERLHDIHAPRGRERFDAPTDASDAKRVSAISSPLVVLREIGDIVERGARESPWMHSIEDFQTVQLLNARLWQLVELQNPHGNELGGAARIPWRLGETQVALRAARIPADRHIYDVPERLDALLQTQHGDMLRSFPAFATFRREYENAAIEYRGYIDEHYTPMPPVPIVGKEPPSPAELAEFYTLCLEEYDRYERVLRVQLDNVLHSARLAMQNAPDADARMRVIGAIDSTVSFVMPIEVSRLDSLSAIQSHEWALNWSEILEKGELVLTDEPMIRLFIERWPETIRARVSAVCADARYALELGRHGALQALESEPLATLEYSDAVAARNESRATLAQQLKEAAGLNHELYMGLSDGLNESDRWKLRSVYTRQRIKINDRSIQTRHGHVTTTLADANAPVATIIFETELNLIEIMVAYVDYGIDARNETVGVSADQASCLTSCLSELRAILSISADRINY